MASKQQRKCLTHAFFKDLPLQFDNIGWYGYSVDMTFTSKNIQRAVQEVKETHGLGFWLRVPRSKQYRIVRQFSSASERVKAYINYFMEHDPLASWRAVIVALDAMGEKKVADAIRHLAEPLTGSLRYR